MGNELDIFEMVMVTFAGGMVKNVQIKMYDWLWAKKYMLVWEDSTV